MTRFDKITTPASIGVVGILTVMGSVAIGSAAMGTATTEPATTEPVATEPVTTGSVAAEPATTEPVATEPAVTEPAATEPPPPTEQAATEAPEIEITGDVRTPFAIDNEYFILVWDAREVLEVECMRAAGFEYEPRPNPAALSAKGMSEAEQAPLWAEWEETFLTQPGFESALLGDEGMSGCQGDAYRVVHGPGEPAYAQMANLYNLMVGYLFEKEDGSQGAVDEWLRQNNEAMAAIRADIETERQSAIALL